MKNLKKALSMVLASAMLFGMMVVGTGAAHSDVKAEHNVEAIAVVSAAGIMGANEEFNPDANITRNEMAVVMVNMLDLNTDDFAGASNFTDVPAWAADYVDACYANGIVSGVSATEYNGAANVTTAEAALMMLKALGYFEEAKLNDWLLDTIKMASKAELLDGIDAKATAKLTRNEVAQLALNALEATCVEETATGSNTSIKGEDFEITVDSTVYRNDLTTKKYDYNKSGENTLQLIEKLFGADFEKDTTGETKLGLPATVWYDEEDEEIVFVADEADDVVVAGKATDTEALYLDKVDEDFDVADGITKTNVKAGDVVYYYEQDDDSVKAYVVSYTLGQITDVKTDIRTADKKDGVSAYVYIGDKKYNDTKIAGFDADTYVEDAYVLYVEKNNEIVDSEIAEIVEGKITGTRDGKVKINGEYYGLNDGLTDAEKALLVKNAKVEVVLNKADQIVVASKSEAAASSDYIYVYSCDVDKDGYTNEDGIKVDETVVTVWGVLADGSKVKYVVKDGEDEVKAGVYAYSIEKGEIVFEKENEKVDLMKAATLDKKDTSEAGVYANSATNFVFVSKDDNKIVVTTVTGVKNVNIDADIYAIYDEDDKDMLTVFVLAEEAELEIDADYAILLDDVVTEEVNADDDKETDYIYTVSIDGKETTLTFETEALKGYAIGAIFTYEMEGEFAINAKAVEAAPVEKAVNVDRVGEDFYVIGNKEYTLADDAEEYTLTFVFDEDAAADSVNMDDVDEIEIETSATLKKDAKVIFVANTDKEIEVVFVIKTVR